MNQMQTEPLVTHTLSDGVRRIVLGRPPAHPLSSQVIAALDAELQDAATDDATRVLVIDGPGHIFCAGHDLKEIARHRDDDDGGRAFLTDLFEACARMMLSLARHPKPTIAMVDGIATAAGLQLAASCDLVFASYRATFCLPGVKNGGFCTTPAVGVSRAVARNHVMELALSAEPLDIDWGLRAGLVNRAFSAHSLEAETLAFAATLASRNPAPVRAGKAALDAHLPLSLEEAYDLATPVMIDHFMDEARLKAEREGKAGLKS
ncbi:enoyl-CoA hydratase-related protein [Lutimaribacter sp. EGI FJ00015]|uniref:Enoyl-CoA hydratase-related protein n=1 Tax=Lutimaribacter degradans TaxID=2945989 RepID=A0ACC5ZVB3_9RHOB|nr:enoyl-CoA hydratase-related protein [Lutimaribacter sp. EGI FJ00013]MCM2561329.1 enoyl-CoA hydratase-related protein [Lutimaribacter sp. EGI FJ00013]MCO0611720.1 enoyl-CoA hydratase-related protein [Lutimaribacter sp. EGI FJ00015]MCO0635158.1 enoyl-CoA hydratase-related protein [Lutimaribacter sp. EGI FJ00014]